MFSAKAKPTDPLTRHVEKTASLQAAQKKIAAWKSEMPQTAPAYQASGAVPASAMAAMLAGGVAGCVAAVVAEIVITASVVLLCLLLSLGLCGLVIFVPTIFGLAVGFIGGGWVAAWLVDKAAVWGKCRSEKLCLVVAVLSAGLSGLALSTCSVLAIHAMFEEVASLQVWILCTVCGLIGSAVAGATAYYSTLDRVKHHRFCEPCSCSLDKNTVKKLPLAGLRKITDAIRKKNLRSTLDTLAGASGKCGDVLIFRCPSCRSGYLEVWATFSAVYFKNPERRKDSGERTVEETWLVASVALPAKQIEQLMGNPQ